MSALRISLVLCLFPLAACSDFPSDGTACDSSVCNGNGTCSYQGTRPICACSPGYTGVVCSRCDTGFHRAEDGTCAADDACSPGLCGANGQCTLVNGRASCACALGFSGAQCAGCRAGYHSESDGGCSVDLDCRPTTCAGGGTCSAASGRVSCTCPAGRSGAYCEVTSATCAMNDPCSSHGGCLDTGGVVRCACDVGYTGATCSECYPGFGRTDAGACEQLESCVASTCSFAGTCAADGGAASCACDTGYAGARCSECATGFHRGANYRCVADQTCAASNPCVGPGACIEQGGAVGCQCATGYAGLDCSACYPGYHSGAGADGGVACLRDDSCRPETCRYHGTCTADGGVTSCVCDPGFGGSNCQTNLDDCVNSACGSGQCVDLLNANVCLCSGGVYGQVCP